MSRDRISITGLRVFARHGVFEHERRDGQEFVIDAAVWLDASAAAARDDVTQTIDYGALAGLLAAAAEGPPVALLETLAERLAGVCLSQPGAEEAEITVHKPHAPIPHRFADVAVTIRRTRA